MGLHREAVRVCDTASDVCLVRHIHVDDAAARATFGVVMGLISKIVAIGAVGNLNTQNVTTLSEHAQIAVHRRARNAGMLHAHLLEHVGRRGVVVQRPHRIENQGALDSVA